MVKKIELTQELLKEYFRYDPETGDLIKIKKSRGRDKLGEPLRCPDTEGYYRTEFNKKRYFVHRLIFFYHHNYFPKQIDHIDGNKQNNRIENLRECTNQQNSFNRSVTKRNKLGIRGVYLRKDIQKFCAKLNLNGKTIHLGFFTNLEDATAARQAAEIKYFGEFRRGIDKSEETE